MPERQTARILEIAELLGVTHQRASVIARQPGFPAPVGEQGQSRVRDRREVERIGEACAIWTRTHAGPAAASEFTSGPSLLDWRSALPGFRIHVPNTVAIEQYIVANQLGLPDPLNSCRLP